MVKYLLYILLICSSLNCNGQVKVWLNFGDEAATEGDHYGAGRFYEKAWLEDSTAEGLVFKLGVSYLNYHNYAKSKKYFLKIEESQALQISHPDFHFWLGVLFKRLGEYEKSKSYFEQYLRTRPDLRSVSALKAKYEVKNHQQILSLLSDTTKVKLYNLGGAINSSAADYYSVWLNDSNILYSSLKAKKIGADGEIEDEAYTIQIENGALIDSVWTTINTVGFKPLLPQQIPASKQLLEFIGDFTDGTFTDEGVFYFTVKTNLGNYQIAKSELLQDTMAEKLLFKTGSVELLQLVPDFWNYSFRNPFYLEKAGKEFLLFSSNLKGGKGGMDLWYSEYRKGKWTKPKNLGAKVNSPGNEIGPVYDYNEGELTFSSDFLIGLGGFDLFKATGYWKRPNGFKNKGIPFNTRFNDLYFSPLNEYSGMLTSNRAGSITDKDAFCCNDLFKYEFEKPTPIQVIDSIFSREDVMLRLQKLVEEYRVTLYFHNDRPNPRTRDTTTQLNYITTYEGYLDSLPTYFERNTMNLPTADSLAAAEKTQAFFDDYVHKGVDDLKIFARELLRELEAGNKIELSVKGYASPLAKSDYNVNLTLRRISSMQNYLREYKNGAFIPFLEDKASNGGLLRINKIPFGEYKSDTAVSDNYYNTKSSVYSVGAALERKIEVINLTLIDESKPLRDSAKVIYHDLDSVNKVFNLGLLDTNKFDFYTDLYNSSNDSVFVTNIDAVCHCVTPLDTAFVIAPKSIREVKFKFDLSEYDGKLGRKVELQLNQGTISRFILLMELPLFSPEKSSIDD